MTFRPDKHSNKAFTIAAYQVCFVSHDKCGRVALFWVTTEPFSWCANFRHPESGDCTNCGNYTTPNNLSKKNKEVELILWGVYTKSKSKQKLQLHVMLPASHAFCSSPFFFTPRKYTKIVLHNFGTRGTSILTVFPPPFIAISVVQCCVEMKYVCLTWVVQVAWY